MILNELLTNALKHAFPGNTNPKIWISLKNINDSMVQFCLKDNGIGLPHDLNLKESSSLGLTLVFSLVETQLEGKIEFENTDGLQCTITFEKTGYQERVLSSNS